VEVKAFEQLVAEVVPLDHAKVVDRLVSHCEFHPEQEKGVRLSLALKPVSQPGSRQTTPERLRKNSGRATPTLLQPLPQPSDSRGSHLPQAEEGRCELVADKASSIGVQVPPVDGQPFCNVPQLGSAGFRLGPLPTQGSTPGPLNF
jgi:hypothetical protein